MDIYDILNIDNVGSNSHVFVASWLPFVHAFAVIQKEGRLLI